MKTEEDLKRWIVRRLVGAGEDPGTATDIAEAVIAAAKLDVFDPDEDWTDRVLKWVGDALAGEPE